MRVLAFSEYSDGALRLDEGRERGEGASSGHSIGGDPNILPITAASQVT